MYDKILEQVNNMTDEVVEFTRKLIRTESITGNEGNVQEEVAAELSQIGLGLDIWEPDEEELSSHPLCTKITKGFHNRPIVVGLWDGKDDARSLLLNGHVDVVKPGTGWRHDPFGAEIENGRIYGRGASDMKGGVAAMIMAVKALKSLGLNPAGRVIIESVVDEENGINGSLAGLLRGYTAAACINCEASDLEIQRAHSGIMEYFLHVYGRPTPISKKDEFISPIERGCRFVHALKDLESILRVTHNHPLFPRGSMNIYVTSFHCGIQTTVLPDEAIIGGMVRLLPGMDARQTRELVQEYIERVARQDPLVQERLPEIRWEGLYAESMEIAEDSPLVECLKQAYYLVSGNKPTISGHEGACDPWIINNHGGIPTVIFGPGKITQMHAVDEYVEIEDLIAATKTLAVAIFDWSIKQGDGSD